MKKLIFTLIILCANSVSAQYHVANPVKINAMYSELQKNPESKDLQQAFFDSFPSAWLDYVRVYFSVKNIDYEPGADVYEVNPDAMNHCWAMAKLNEIPDSTYCNKIVNVAVGAVDTPPGFYMKNLQHHVMNSNRRDTMLHAISSMMNGDRLLYWSFYWSNGLPKNNLKKEYLELDTYMRSHGYSDEADLMKIAFDNFHGKSNEEAFRHVNMRQYEGNCN